MEIASPDSSSKATSTTPILSLSARKGEFFGVINTLPATTFSFNQDRLEDYGVDKRSEWDISLGWSPQAVPGFAVLLGYKWVKHAPVQPEEDGGTYKMQAPIVGVSYTRPLTGKAFAYANGALSIGGKQEGATGEFNGQQLPLFEKKPKYSTAEIGVGTVLDNGIALTLGWRYQKLKLDVAPPFSQFLNGKVEEEGKGVTLAVGFNF